MKKVLFLIVIAGLFISCKKEPITPGNYKLVEPTEDTTNWQNQYTNGGTVPTWGTSNDTNEVFGTTWVLTYLQIGFSTPPLPSDTIRFVSNISYTINGGAVKPYTLTAGIGTSSKSLTLNYHYPFGSGNYVGQVANTFVSDGMILNCEFINTNTTTIMVRASFTKL
jgi:hypothetical protein